MCQPDVICGHFWKGSLYRGYKVLIFLWETGLQSVIGKSHEIDLLLYACSSDKAGLIAHHPRRQRSIQDFPSSYLGILALFVLCQKQKTSKPIWSTEGSEQQLPTLIFPKNWFGFCMLLHLTQWSVSSLKTSSATAYHVDTLPEITNSFCTALSSFLFFTQANSSAFLISVEMIQNEAKDS